MKTIICWFIGHKGIWHFANESASVGYVICMRCARFRIIDIHS
jgi:hypothetical protein